MEFLLSGMAEKIQGYLLPVIRRRCLPKNMSGLIESRQIYIYYVLITSFYVYSNLFQELFQHVDAVRSKNTIDDDVDSV